MKFGSIGTGNMGGAIAQAISKTLQPGEQALSNLPACVAEDLAKKIGAVATTNADIAENAKYIVLGVKPQILPEVTEEIKGILAARKDRFVIISMAAGIKTEKIQDLLGAKYPVVRIMPNLPVSVGKGVIMITKTPEVTDEEFTEVKGAFREAGLVDEMPEHLIDAGTAVTGCGPAYMFMAIEAIADGAVACGIPRAKALQYATALMEGSAVYLKETGKHPGELKDAVCSPGGSTIKGVASLEEDGFRSALIKAVEVSYDASKKLG
ncbi:MAG: pyrroline-5-carboxylate reductase [Lachnospiraceae bacterium]|nr:pyrroline-5-carboxylate reductase [Lachnospiraceae bacterium]